MRKNTKAYQVLSEVNKDTGTTVQIADRTAVKRSTVAYYLSTMKGKGWVQMSHIYPVGNPCFVWEITDEGKQQLG